MNKHIEVLERLSGDAQALAEALVYLRDLGPLGDAKAAAEQRLDLVRSMVSEEEAKLSKALQGLATARGEAEAAKLAAQEQAEATHAAALEEASAIVAKAKAEAEKVAAEIKANQAAAHEREHLEETARRRAQAEAEATVAARRVELESVDEEVTKARAELDRVNATIAEARAKLGA